MARTRDRLNGGRIHAHKRIKEHLATPIAFRFVGQEGIDGLRFAEGTDEDDMFTLLKSGREFVAHTSRSAENALAWSHGQGSRCRRRSTDKMPPIERFP